MPSSTKPRRQQRTKASKAAPKGANAPSGKRRDVQAFAEVAGHRLYRLPAEYRGGTQRVYDGTTNTVYEDLDALSYDLEFPDEVDDDTFPMAQAKSRDGKGFSLHVVYDPIAKQGIIYLESNVTSDADVEVTKVAITWGKLVREGNALLRDADTSS